ncbi:hypothetical protein [Pseudomarimonas salicorniae]|uniref:Uncharacterized protein n=1 Tax=Pseudomarimonas salicorniae TaxID=2933270 RepID=A0ABT0GHG5_9GAMM|nr:hypothetical protein [Lysobacter sp. CAU 1642]MCK7593978.1 hypothetical protein [Lysobacter sp. CAU 1642]
MALLCVGSAQGFFGDGFESQAGEGVPPGSRIHTLWLGNSLTNTPPDFNDYSQGALPARLAPMLAEFGITLSFDAITPGGAEFSNHAQTPSTMAALSDPAYDFVNLQGYYVGFDSAAAYASAVKPLHDAATAAGSVVLYEGMWPYLTDPGSPQHPTAALAVEGAADAKPNAFAVQVGRAWEQVRLGSSSLHAKLRSDNTHQSAVGEYLNALVYTRFFTGQSVANVASISPQAAARLSSAERTQLKQAVDLSVNRFYRPTGASSVQLTISEPAEDAAVPAGQPLRFSAAAIDDALGDISADIHWFDDAGLLRHSGASFSFSPAVGFRSMRAEVQGSGGAMSALERRYRALGAGNTPPEVSDKPQSVPRNSPFTQANLSANARDLEGSVDWATLQLDLSTFDGVSAVQNDRDPFTVDLDYSNGYRGSDRIRWRVADDQGAWSAWARIQIQVQ